MTDEFRLIPTATLLAGVAAARAAGDWRTAQDEWWACVARAKERVVLTVDRYVHRDLVAAADAEDIVQDALIRGGRALVENLDDLSEGAFFAAMITAAHHQCMDEGRKYKRRKQTKSLDQPAGWSDEPDGPGRYDQATAKQARTIWERDGEVRELEQLFDRLIPQLRDERARTILTADRIGDIDDAKLADQLGISVPNLHQIRSRALKELRGLIDR